MGSELEIQIPVPWGHISAKTYGKSTGRSVLTIHDWLDNAGSFDKLAPLLSDTLYIVAIDLPGHGKSSHLPAGVVYHILDCIPALNRVIEHFKWKRFSIMGHGTGGGLAVLYATVYSSNAHKTKLDRLVLLNTIKPTSVPDEGGAPIISSAIKELLNIEQNKHEEPDLSFEECLESLIVESDNRQSEEVAKILMSRGAVQGSEGKWSLSRDLKLKIPDTLRLTHEQCFSLLREVKLPVLIVKSQDTNLNIIEPETRIVNEKALAIYRHTCSSFELVEVEGTYYVHLGQSERIAKTVSDFLIQ